MESQTGTEDDQGSGWLEVRKKHRISSKSIEKLPGESSNTSHSWHYQIFKKDKVGRLPTEKQARSCKERVRINPDSNVSSITLDPSSEDAGENLQCLDRLVSSDHLSYHSITTTDSTIGSTETKGVVGEEKLDNLPKVKQGDDIGDISLTVSVTSDSGKFSFNNCLKQPNLAPIDSPDVFIRSSEDQLYDMTLSLETPKDSVAETWRDVSEVSFEYKDITDNKSEDAFRNLKESHGASGMQNESMNVLISEDANFVGSLSLASPIGGVIEINNENENNGVKFSDDDPASTKDVSSDEVNQGEDEQSEGKERFRERLWCFLFENLNRAVDELYLLCELECDMEQMNEAILVLEEAMSDFGELKCRVEHFEGTKRLVTQSSKDMAMMKTDHRRPHALSWEVRRMTTSPYRAEILSSSLEAFRKIQFERASIHIAHDRKDLIFPHSTPQNCSRNSPTTNGGQRQTAISESPRREASIHGKTIKGNTNLAASMHSSRSRSARSCLLTSEKLPVSASVKKEPLRTISEFEKQAFRKEKLLADNKIEKEKDKGNAAPWKTMDAWKEKRNWEDILKSPLRSSSRVSCSPGVGRKCVERARVLHDKLMSPEKKKKNALDTRKEAEERHARAMRIRGQLENERLQRLQRASEKFNRVNEWQAVRNLKLREGLNTRQQRSESRHEAHLAQVVKRAGDESSKVNEVRFITSLNEENKKLILRQKLHNSELRRAEKIQTIRIKQKEDTAREEAAMERRKLLEAEKMQRLAETQRKKEEAQLRKEEERKASSAAREAKAVEQLRRKELRAKAQQEEAELLAQKLAEKLSESEQRRKIYLEQIREKASTDFRDQSSPLLRRSLNRDLPSRHLTTDVEDNQPSCILVVGDSVSGSPYPMQQQPLKRRIKRIRQRLMALKHDFIEPSFVENSGVGYRALVGTARVKIGKWLQEFQRLRQARKEGAASIGLIVGDMIKFMEGKELELHASRQAGLLDFISSALPASHTSKPEACQVTVFLLRLLRVVLSVPANKCYFLALNLLPPIIPMLSASLDNYIKAAASSNLGSSNLTNKTTTDNMDTITEVLDCLLFTVTAIMGYTTNDERGLQMQEGLLELIVSYQVIHRLRDLFALYDRPQVEGSPFPSSIMLSLNLLSVLTSRPGSMSSIDWEAGLSNSTSENKNENSQLLERNDVVDKFVLNDPMQVEIVTAPPQTEFMPADESTQMLAKSLQPAVVKLEEKSKSLVDQEDQKIAMNSHIGRKRIDELALPSTSERKKEVTSNNPVTFFLSAMAETGLVSLTSLLTAVLLQANSRLSSDQASYVLPSNFEEAAIGVLKVLNNLACLDISLLQKMLAMSDLRMEFFHLMSFLLSHCTNRWKSANDQAGLLLLESLLLLGYFSLLHIGNQAVLRWGKSPTILHKVCDLPFVFFSDPELTPILAGTFVAACYGCEQNRGVVQQELSIDMLLTLLRSCRPNLLPSQFDPSVTDIHSANCLADSVSSEVKKICGDNSLRSSRKGVRNGLGKGGSAGARAAKFRAQRENRGTNICDDWAFKHNLPAAEASFTFMLHRRFPKCFLDKAEEFFAAGTVDLPA